MISTGGPCVSFLDSNGTELCLSPFKRRNRMGCAKGQARRGRVAPRAAPPVGYAATRGPRLGCGCSLASRSGLHRAQHHPEPKCREAAGDTEHNIGCRDECVAALQEEHRLESECGECSKASEDAREEQEARIRREQVVLLDEPGQDTGKQASNDVDDEGAGGEPPIHRVMQDIARELVPCDRSNRTTDGNREKPALMLTDPARPLPRQSDDGRCETALPGPREQALVPWRRARR